MLIWLQGGKLVWSDGSPADFSVWLEGGLNYKVCLHLFSEVGLNFLYAKFFCTHCHHNLKVPTLLRFPGLALLFSPQPSFKWDSFRGSVIWSFRGSVIWEKKLVTDFVLRRRVAVQGSVKKKRTEWKTSMFAKSKSLTKVDPHITWCPTHRPRHESVLINYL